MQTGSVGVGGGEEYYLVSLLLYFILISCRFSQQSGSGKRKCNISVVGVKLHSKVEAGEQRDQMNPAVLLFLSNWRQIPSHLGGKEAALQFVSWHAHRFLLPLIFSCSRSFTRFFFHRDLVSDNY